MANDITMGTGAEALAAERMSADLNEPCRVRCVRDGLYLHTNRSAGEVALRWGLKRSGAHGGVWPRATAGHIANAMIALTGDLGIEIEPV
jgi:hypothetical protein